MSGELIKQGGDISEMYPTTMSEKKIQHAAEEIILKHGDDAFAEAHRIRELQALNDYGDALNKNVTLSE